MLQNKKLRLIKSTLKNAGYLYLHDEKNIFL